MSIKISQLTEVSEISTDAVVPVVNEGETVKVKAENMFPYVPEGHTQLAASYVGQSVTYDAITLKDGTKFLYADVALTGRSINSISTNLKYVSIPNFPIPLSSSYTIQSVQATVRRESDTPDFDAAFMSVGGVTYSTVNLGVIIIPDPLTTIGETGTIRFYIEIVATKNVA